MKKILAIILALALVLSFAACGSKTPEPAPNPTPAPDPTVEPIVEPTVEPTEEPQESPEPSVEPTAEPTPEPTPAPTPEPTPVPTPMPTPEPTPTPAPAADPLSDCTALLAAVWDAHSEDEKFPVAGGDGDSINMGGPGSFGLDAANLDAMLGLPASGVELIDSAASLMHMMNANTFTCGAYHVSDASNVATVAQSLRDNIQGRQWCCGFPERVVVISVGNYIISIFGHEDVVNTFVNHVSALFSAAVLYNEAIA